jgi:hypothetical protein
MILEEKPTKYGSDREIWTSKIMGAVISRSAGKFTSM